MTSVTNLQSDRSNHKLDGMTPSRQWWRLKRRLFVATRGQTPFCLLRSAAVSIMGSDPLSPPTRSCLERRARRQGVRPRSPTHVLHPSCDAQSSFSPPRKGGTFSRWEKKVYGASGDAEAGGEGFQVAADGVGGGKRGAAQHPRMALVALGRPKRLDPTYVSVCRVGLRSLHVCKAQG